MTTRNDKEKSVFISLVTDFLLFLPDVVAARRLFVGLARHQGWRDPGALGSALAMSPRAVRRFAAETAPAPGLDAARLCLGDARLLAGPWGVVADDASVAALDRRTCRPATRR